MKSHLLEPFSISIVKGKFVLSSMNQVTGRPEYNWEKFATPESFEKMKKDKIEASRKWNANYRKMGVNRRNIIKTLEEAGAAGILSSYWAGGFGADRIFGAGTKTIPNIESNLKIESLGITIEDHDNGVKVTSVDDVDSSLTNGDIITEVNREIVNNINEFEELVNSLEKTGRSSLLLKIIRDDEQNWVTIKFKIN